MTGLPDRLVFERNRIRGVLGKRWKAALLLSSGRLAFDFGTLLACIRATGVKPNPSLVLLAYAVAGLLALIPITPGGLGIVEAGLSALLILAGVPGVDAVVATLAYRIISYWLPIAVGPFAYFAFRLRYGKPGHDGGAGAAGAGASGAAGRRRGRGERHWDGLSRLSRCAAGRTWETARLMYEGTWESVRTHRVPVWYDDAKLGIFIHWGLYSVPGWAPRVPDIQQLLIQDGPKRMLRENPYAEWYRNSMQIKGSPTHRTTPRSTARTTPTTTSSAPSTTPRPGADLDAIADLCQAAGARYVVLTTKHHDGFALWPSSVPHPVKGEYRARRDLVGDLTEAVRARRMRMGLYYSGGYDWPYNDAVLTTAADAVLAAPQDPAYVEYVTAHVRELIDRYEPSVLWNDISWPTDPRLPRALRRLLQRGGGRRHQRPLEGARPGAQRVTDAAGARRRRGRAGAVAVHPRAAQAPHLRHARSTTTSARPSTTCCARPRRGSGSWPAASGTRSGPTATSSPRTSLRRRS